MAVAGDSAGGTLAALACLRLRSERPTALPDLQVLLYANTDLTGACPSMRENATGFGLTAEDVRTFSRFWMPNESRWADPAVSPLHAPDLTGLPPALIVTAEYDPLRDEGEEYARRLTGAGVEVTLRRQPGLIHNFLMLDELSPASAAAADRIAADIHDRLRRYASPAASIEPPSGLPPAPTDPGVNLPLPGSCHPDHQQMARRTSPVANSAGSVYEPVQYSMAFFFPRNRLSFRGGNASGRR